MIEKLSLLDSTESCVESPFLPLQKVGTQTTLESSLRKISKSSWQSLLQIYTITYFLWILRNCWNLLKILRFYCYLRLILWLFCGIFLGFYKIYFCFLYLIKCGLPLPPCFLAKTAKRATLESLQDSAKSFCFCVKYGEIPHKKDFYA